MAGRSLAGVLRYVRGLADANACDHSDRALLERFISGRDEGAFAALLQRHGPFVLGVCRHVLGSEQDAEDAFQATFLVLARKASSIRRQESLAAWLHRVAINIAHTARASAARREAHERQAAVMAQRTPAEDSSLADWRPILHEEVHRLPEKYRLPVVLCYIRGMTHAEAAQELGWPPGTVKGRLARARLLLRARLARRGLALTAAAGVLAVGGPEAAGVVVSGALVGSTLRAALAFAGRGTIPAGTATAQALILAQGVIRSMTAAKLSQVIVLLLAAGVISVGATLAAGGRWGVPQEGLSGNREQALPGQEQATDQAGRGGAPMKEKDRLPSNRAVSPVVAAAESRPVRVNEVDFQAVIDARCPTPAPGEKQFVDLGLRLTNRGTKTMLFNLYDTLRLRLRSTGGKELECDSFRKRTRLPQPVLLRKGETTTVYLEAFLRWREDRPGRLQLSGTDPTAAFWSFDGVAPGKYLLRVEHENTEEQLATFQRDRRVALQPEPGQAFWLGKAAAEVEFEVTAPARPARNLGAAPVERLIGDLESPDGAKRIAATRELLRRGKAVLEDLKKAGAREVVPVRAPTEKQPATRRLDLVYSLIRGLPRVDPKTGTGIRGDRITLRLEKGVTRKEFDRMARQYRFGLHVERRDMFRADAPTVCDVVTTQPALETVLEAILTTEPRVESISLIVPVASEG